MSESLSVIPFGELTSGASVRVALIKGVQYLSVRDIIMVMCGQTADRATKTWRNLSDKRKEEVRQILTNLKFKGTGQKEQPVIQFQGAIKMMMWLPGEQAKQFRSQASAILTRYYAGDKTLLADVIDNAESGAGINKAARDALPDLVDDMGTKRRRIVTTISEKELVRMKEQNVFLREHIKLKREFYGIEMDYQQRKSSVELTHEQEMLNVVVQRNSQDLEYKKALKAVESGPVQATRTSPAEVSSSPPTGFTTALTVFEKNVHEFLWISPEYKGRFFSDVGKKVSEAYKKAGGMHPPPSVQDHLGLTQYPIAWENTILEALRAVRMYIDFVDIAPPC